MSESIENIVNIKTKEQFDEVINNWVLTIVDFWAEWCGPCRMMIPILHKIAENHPEIQLATVNVDECRDLAFEYDVSSIPAVFIIKNWQIVDSFVWVLPENVILEKIATLNTN